MKVVATAVNDLYAGDCRLDASYHASAGVKALRRLRRWAGVTMPSRVQRSATRESAVSYGSQRLDALKDVAQIFNGPRFARIYVTNLARGIPFLSSSDMLQADLSGVKLLSSERTPPKLLDAIRIQQGWTLISCSGTIGNTVYVRSDMDGMTGSQHIMRVVPDEKVIRPGYLFTVLSSQIGYALLTQGTYGAVVQHIEPHHIADLPIPRLDAIIEARIHALVERAAALRVEANRRLLQARKMLEGEAGFANPQKSFDHAFSIGKAKIDTSFGHRLDSFAYVGYTAEAIHALEKYAGQVISAPDAGFEIYNPPLFKRMFANHGHPYMSGVEIYTLRPTTTRYLSRVQPEVEQYLVTEGMVLVQSAGQRYGLITTPVLVTRMLNGVAATSDIVRIKHPDIVENGYICALLASDFGRRLALRYSYGTSIPRLNVPEFSKIKIPWPDDNIRRGIGQMTVDAYEQRDEANLLEDQAQVLLVEALGFGE